MLEIYYQSTLIDTVSCSSKEEKEKIVQQYREEFQSDLIWGQMKVGV